MGQPDPCWAEAPEFDWIPDKPFHAAPAANINEPPPPAPEPVTDPAPTKPAIRARPHFGLRQSLQRQSEKALERARDGAARLRKLSQALPREPVSPSRVEPHFEFPSSSDAVAEPVAEGATEEKIPSAVENAAQTAKQFFARTGVSVHRTFAEAGTTLRDSSAAATRKTVGLGEDATDLFVSAGERLAALAAAFSAAVVKRITTFAAGAAAFFIAARTFLVTLSAAAVALCVWAAGQFAILAVAAARWLAATGRSVLVQLAAPAEKAAPSRLPLRLAIGTLQGVGFAIVGAPHTFFSAALSMVLLFAPLLLLAGIGRMPARLLLSWTGFAAAALAAMGAYQYWRMPDENPVAAMMMAALFLFIGQTLLTASAQEDKPVASYPACFGIAWELAVTCTIWLLCAAVAALFADGLGNLMRQYGPGMHLLMPIAPLAALAVACASWLLPSALVRRLVQGLLASLTLLLPALVLLALSVVAALLALHWQPPLLLDLVLATGLLLSINASHGGGAERARWRQIMEFAASFALACVTASAGWSLYARTASLGWTSARVMAAALVAALAVYAASYCAAALISLGGGRWMQRLERANLAIALAGLGLLAALLSPLADPARLAVQSQARRVESGLTDPEAFDFRTLRDNGGRFGRDALIRMASLTSKPEVARGAYLALTTDADAPQPMPTQIGANIEVHGGALPAGLLTQDWSKAASPDVPPCLTHVALRCEAYFADLDGDGAEEIVLAYGTDARWWAAVMKQDQAGWHIAGTLATPCRGGLNALRSGRFAPIAPLPGWRDLLAGGMRLTIAPAGPAKNAGCSS